MELERHIEILLLDNDCVIVPGLGGFIAYHTDASYDSESASFIPPTRVAGFNPKLSMNDNLLAQSYVETYDISYPEAVKRITAEANALKDKLELYGFYELPGVGTLKVNHKGGYDFIPFEAGLLTPEYYGLGCFEAIQLTQPSDTEDSTGTENITDNNSSKFIRIKVSTIRNVVAAAIAIFAFFLLSSPLGKSNQNVASVASLQNSVFQKMIPVEFETEGNTAATKHLKSSTIKTAKTTDKKIVAAADSIKAPVTNTVLNTDSSKTNAQKNINKKDIKKAESVKNKRYYSIVLASALSKNNASNYVDRLTADGYKDIHSIECSNGMKVVCGKFASEKEAYASLSTLRSNKDFKDAWIYKVRAKK